MLKDKIEFHRSLVHMRECCKEWKKEVDSCTIIILLENIRYSEIPKNDFIKINNHNPCLRIFWFNVFEKYYNTLWGGPYRPRMEYKLMHMVSEPWIENLDHRDNIYKYILTEKELPQPLGIKTHNSLKYRIIHFQSCIKKCIDCQKCSCNGIQCLNCGFFLCNDVNCIHECHFK